MLLFVNILLFLIALMLIVPRYKNPRVIPNLLSKEECEYIISKATPNLSISTVSRGKSINLKVRKSETAWLGFEDDKIKDIVMKCLKYVNINNTHYCERLQVLRYEKGGMYKVHQDAEIDDVNKRKYTFILALNEGYEGGETNFPVLKRSYKLKMGDVLLFDTLDTWGRIPEQALHSGEPLKGGEKWICNLWVHESKYHP
jgi:predicted 2-oxoglutarate/Fe(II)-dependent dioxygenase YbiX